MLEAVVSLNGQARYHAQSQIKRSLVIWNWAIGVHVRVHLEQQWEEIQ